ncbi:hypothetical protein Efla_006298 [Eimeria flavescens]
MGGPLFRGNASVACRIDRTLRAAVASGSLLLSSSSPSSAAIAARLAAASASFLRVSVSPLSTTPHWLERCAKVPSSDGGGEEKEVFFEERVSNNTQGDGFKAKAFIKLSSSGGSDVTEQPADAGAAPSAAILTSPAAANNSGRRISSRHHELVKHLLRLKARRRYRSTSGQLVVLGVDTLRSICSLPPRVAVASENPAAEGQPVEGKWKPEASVILTDSLSLATKAASSGLTAERIELATKEVMNVVSERRQPAYTAVSGVRDKSLESDFPPSLMRAQAAAIFTVPPPCEDFVKPRFVLAFDRLRYVWNLGILLRCAAALRVDGLFFIEGTADPFNWKALEVSRGLHCQLPYLWGSSRELLEFCGKHRLAPIVADIGGDPIEGFRERIAGYEGVCCILGSESQGPSSTIKQHAMK